MIEVYGRELDTVAPPHYYCCRLWLQMMLQHKMAALQDIYGAIFAEWEEVETQHQSLFMSTGHTHSLTKVQC